MIHLPTMLRAQKVQKKVETQSTRCRLQKKLALIVFYGQRHWARMS